MAHLKLAYGNSENLENLPIEDGKLIFTPDTRELYIDYAAEEGGTAERIQASVQADWAEQDTNSSAYIKSKTHGYTIVEYGASSPVIKEFPKEFTKVLDFTNTIAYYVNCYSYDSIMNCNEKIDVTQVAVVNEVDLGYTWGELTILLPPRLQRIGDTQNSKFPGAGYNFYFIVNRNTLSEEDKARFDTNGIYFEALKPEQFGRYRNLQFQLRDYFRLKSTYMPTDVVYNSQLNDKIITPLTNNTNELTVEQKQSAQDWLGVTEAIEEATPTIMNTINSTGTTTIITDAIPTEQVVTAHIRKTHNIYDFDRNILSDLPNRVYTTDMFLIEDYSFIQAAPDYQYWCHFYDENKILIGSDTWRSGGIAFSSLLNVQPFGCKYFRVAISRWDNADITPETIPEDAISLTINPTTSNLNGSEYVSSAVLAQGTIDAGTVYPSVNTRVHFDQNQHLQAFQSFNIPEGYKASIHIYNQYEEWLAAGNWITGPATMTPQQIIDGSVYYTPIYCNMVLGKVDDTVIEVNNLPSDLIQFTGIAGTPETSQGTLIASVVNTIVQDLNWYDGINEAVDTGSGTFKVTGKLYADHYNPVFSFDFGLLLQTLQEDRQYTLSIRYKNKGDNTFNPLPFKVYNQQGEYTSVNGSITFGLEDRMSYLDYFAETDIEFNETMFYIQLEEGAITHDWEEYSDISIDEAEIKFYHRLSPDIVEPSIIENNSVTTTIYGPNVTIVHSPGIRINLTYEANMPAYFNNVGANHAPVIRAMTHIDGNIVEINDAIEQKQKCQVSFRKSYNLYDFDNSFLSHVTNRIYTTDYIPMSRYVAMAIPAGQQIAYHVFNSSKEYLDSYYWYEGSTAIEMSSIRNYHYDAAYLKVTVARTNDQDLTPADSGLSFILDPLSTDTVSASLTQGTIDNGTVNPNVTTRLHLAHPLPLVGYQNILIAEGYKIWVHFYNENLTHVGSSGAWTTGPASFSLINVLNSYPNIAYFDVVIGTTNDDVIAPSSFPSNVFGFNKYRAETPQMTQGVIERSIVEQLLDDIRWSSYFTSVNNHDGTFTINGTNTSSYNMSLTSTLESLGPIFEVGNTYTLGIKTKSLGDIEYTPFDFTATSPAGSTLYSTNGAITFDYNNDGNAYDIPQWLTIPINRNVTFNETTFYIQIEKGKIAHDWEEKQIDTLNYQTVLVTDNNQCTSYVLNDNAIDWTVEINGPRCTIECPKGVRANNFEYLVDTKAYIDNHAGEADAGNYATRDMLNEYAKRSELNNYATTSQLSNYTTYSTLNSYLSSYVTTSTLNNRLNSYVTTSTLNNNLSNYATKEYVDELITNAIGGSY